MSIPVLVRKTPRFRFRGTAICAAAIMFGATLEVVGSAHAEPAAIVRSRSSSAGRPFAAFIAEASQRFAHSNELGTRCHGR